MARLNEILVGRFNKALQKSFGIKGGPPVATLAPEIMPVHAVFNGQEMRWVEDWRRYGRGVTLAAGAALFGNFLLRNPGGSNVILVVERLLFSQTIAGPAEIQYGATGVDLAVTTTGVALDGRNVARSSGIASTTNNAGSVLSNPVLLVDLLASTPYDFTHTAPDEIAIPPGFAVGIQNDTANTASHFSCVWRERYLEEGERL